ncbi:hypothetical protein CY0110_04723 [Crocosphaera chwakensis CCY0110]|uniref:Uncharacterized protein n=1 Tax=Crocosphaera chwakensis CCY0110 TaxID=391612 RepID=A3IT37_9CHRO|nr:hypothetical protein CY0110_04723 [Crocosphaera chwakensis CCY0110]
MPQLPELEKFIQKFLGENTAKKNRKKK